MSLGIIMLAHTALDRAAQVARHFAKADCPIVIHCDASVPKAEFDSFRASLSDIDAIRWAPRRSCDWGTWGLVGATLDAAELLLESFPGVQHVYLASGACLPLRPLEELKDYLAANPGRDYIESVDFRRYGWVQGGLEEERFTRRFPFSFARQRTLFEGWLNWQRKLNITRKLPKGLVPHLGSQWWCLTRKTLASILLDPERPKYVRYFKRVWIPDESFFQTLVREHSKNVESRSLTLAKFDAKGKPHVFYNDHLRLLTRSDCFMARKIWPGADKLYDTLLSDTPAPTRAVAPNPGKIDRLFSQASDRRMQGRAGLYMQSRWPSSQPPNRQSTGPYSVFQGFADLFPDFEDWLARATDTTVHGRIFHPERVEFAGREDTYRGAQPAAPHIRDYNPCGFLTNLLWNTRGEPQVLMYHPADTQEPWGFMAGDPHARIQIISGAWALGLYRLGAHSDIVRSEAARLQTIETKQIEALTSKDAKARVRVWTLSEFVDQPMDLLAEILDELAPSSRGPVSEAPRMAAMQGFGDFLQSLRNQGLNLRVAGHFPPDDRISEQGERPHAKPYLVRDTRT